MAITVPIITEFSSKGLDEATGKFQTFGNKVAGIAKVTAAAFAAIGGVAVAGAFKAIDAASDLAETQAKVGQIFGDSAKQIEAFASTAAKEFGQSKQDVLNAAGVFGTFGKAAGLSGDDLAKFSNGFTGLASDLASFNNTSPQEAIDAIGAALRGEAEPLRRYGVLLDDATLKAEAMSLGIYDGNGTLTAQQKILAAQAAIYKQTADAQGDFARTSGGLANQQRILKAQLANAVAVIGTKLLPIATTVVSFFADKFIPVVEAVANAFGEGGLAGVVELVRSKLPQLKQTLGDLASAFFAWIRETIPKVVEGLAELGRQLVEWIKPRIKPMLEQLGEWIAAAADWLIDTGLPLLVKKLVELGNALVEWVKPHIVPMLKELGKLLAAIGTWIITDAVPKIAEQALKLGVALLSWVGQLIPEALKGLGALAIELVKKLPGIFVSGVKTMATLGADLGASLINGLVEALKGLLSKGGEIAKQLVNAIFRFINDKFIDKINKLLEFKIPLPGLPDIRINPPDIPRIPYLANGGIVTGPTLAMIGEAGPEAVVPLDRAGRHGLGGNVTVNVYGSVIEERNLIETIRQGLVNSQRSGYQLVYSNTNY